jgi:hypothetical protein
MQVLYPNKVSTPLQKIEYHLILPQRFYLSLFHIPLYKKDLLKFYYKFPLGVREDAYGSAFPLSLTSNDDYF